MCVYIYIYIYIYFGLIGFTSFRVSLKGSIRVAQGDWANTMYSEGSSYMSSTIHPQNLILFF